MLGDIGNGLKDNTFSKVNTAVHFCLAALISCLSDGPLKANEICYRISAQYYLIYLPESPSCPSGAFSVFKIIHIAVLITDGTSEMPSVKTCVARIKNHFQLCSESFFSPLPGQSKGNN